ncbi:MAG: KH domain-containing protein, partial [Victivallales bacterium]|nr:KH domain-containing protein [Victivallales bacterium]
MTVNTKAEKASTTLATMLDYLGLTANVKVEEKKDGKIVLVTYSDDAGRIIGKKGQSLQSLELLVNRMISKDETNSQWVSIDVDGYSSGRSVTAGSNDRKKRFDSDSDKKYSRKPEKSGRRK